MKTAFMALALGIAAASFADDATVTLTTTVNLENSIFAYKNTAAGSSTQDAALLGDIPAGTYSQTISLSGDLSQFATYRYTLLSTYVNALDGHTGVVIGLNPEATTLALGNSFESVFGTNESTIVDAIKGVYSGNLFTQIASMSTLQSFANSNLSKLPLGLTGGSLVAFSSGTLAGTVTAAPVPEPASIIALGAGAAALLRRRRRS